MKDLTNENLICQLAEDIEADVVSAEIVLDVLTEKYDKLELGEILDVMDRNGYDIAIDKLIIAKHNRLLVLHEQMDFLEKCLTIEEI